jgi:subtilisin-like proprotein convertase family protein
VRIFLGSICLIFATLTRAQTFNANLADTIFDDLTNEYILDVVGLSQNLNTTIFGLEQICLTIEHTYLADLEVLIEAPSGIQVSLFSGIGGDSDFLTNSCFSAESTLPINQGQSPYSNIYIPMGQLGYINNGQSGNGIWKLIVRDTWAQDAGNIYGFSVTFGSNPATVFTISESNLPIVMLETNGQEIPNEPKINGNVKIIYNGEGLRNYTNQTDFHFNGNCGLEVRGASSSGMPKKSYDLEIRDAFFADLDTAILGLPSESDWVLSAQYTDKTLMRNMLSMHLLQSMGFYAPRFKAVELFINNEYKGVYIFMEKVKKGVNRVNISTLNPDEISGDDLTGGYILKLDKGSGSSNFGWESPFAPIPAGSSIVLDYEYPKAEAIVQEQKDYIQDYFTDFETALAGADFMHSTLGYRNFVNYESCLNTLLVSEATRSIDAYRKSFFIHKDKDSQGGKLTMAPIWDYDLTYGNADFCEGQNTAGWQYNFNYVCGEDYWINPFWFPRMMEDTIFQQDLKCQWKTLRETSFHTDSIHAWIDQMAANLNESQAWNYTIWQTMGSYVWPNSFVGQNYQEEIDFLKTWITNRFAWLDENLPGNEQICSTLDLTKNEKKEFLVSPNPVENELVVKIDKTQVLDKVIIRDFTGKICYEKEIKNKLQESSLIINDFHLVAGIYSLEIQGDKFISLSKFVKK